MSNHEFYIRECFKLALKAKGQTSPNPYVGAIIVKNNKVISTGYHSLAGMPHAEADAFNKAKEDVNGATLYCNLEPCCHTHKRTPPCAQRIIKEGIKEVIICNLDPNPEVAGKGVKLMQEAGIKVKHGVLADQGHLLNEVFFHHIVHKQPFIHLKWAQTLDGKMATSTNKSKWITSEMAREYVHNERSLYDAILVGAKTAKIDNPSLSIRLNNTEIFKLRIILSSSGELPGELKVLSDSAKDKTIIVLPPDIQFEADDITILRCPLKVDQFDLEKLLSELYALGICSIYIEGGPKTLTQFMKKKKYNRVSIYTAPKIMGVGKAPIEDLEIAEMSELIQFHSPNWQILGPDILMESQRNICLQDL